MLARRIFAAVLIGILLRFVIAVHPVPWLVWFAPVPLLVLALRSTMRQAFGLTFLAAMIGSSVNLHYFRLVMPLPAAVLAMVGTSLLWVLVIGVTRRVVIRYQAWWTVFAYPVIWAAVDTLATHLLRDGNWGSLAYSQAEFLPLLQVTSLFGVPYLLFLLSLLPSALALAIVFGRKIPNVWRAYAITALLLLTSIGYGALRLRSPVSGRQTTDRKSVV